MGLYDKSSYPFLHPPHLLFQLTHACDSGIVSLSNVCLFFFFGK
nr:MAG TPA: hypothetical protein [Caudoviricetes sp.]